MQSDVTISQMQEDDVERIACQRSKKSISISVEQSPAYAAADRLYSELGYVPDGKGITPPDNELHLVKVLARQTE